MKKAVGFDMSINELSFGVPAAERDNELISCFVESDIYRKLLNGEKTIILGNRGSGKSALFKKLADDEVIRKNIVVQLAPDEYSYELLSETMKKEAEGSWAKQGANSAAWKYLMLLRVMKELNKSGRA